MPSAGVKMTNHQQLSMDPEIDWKNRPYLHRRELFMKLCYMTNEALRVTDIKKIYKTFMEYNDQTKKKQEKTKKRLLIRKVVEH